MAVHLVRVIAGSAKGRKLKTPRGLQTRPMTSRAREALFSSLGDIIVGADVLDLYAGSGSLGIEALSRGAARVTFVERARPALAALESNLEITGFEGDVVAADAASAASSLATAYDVVFVDPPFDMPSADVSALLEHLLTTTRPGASVVVHRRVGTEPLAAPAQMAEAGDRRYGDSVLWRFTRDT